MSVMIEQRLQFTILVQLVIGIIANDRLNEYEPRQEKTYLRGSDQVRLKPACSATETR